MACSMLFCALCLGLEFQQGIKLHKDPIQAAVIVALICCCFVLAPFLIHHSMIACGQFTVCDSHSLYIYQPIGSWGAFIVELYFIQC